MRRIRCQPPRDDRSTGRLRGGAGTSRGSAENLHVSAGKRKRKRREYGDAPGLRIHGARVGTHGNEQHVLLFCLTTQLVLRCRCDAIIWGCPTGYPENMVHKIAQPSSVSWFDASTVRLRVGQFDVLAGPSVMVTMRVNIVGK